MIDCHLLTLTANDEKLTIILIIDLWLILIRMTKFNRDMEIT